VVEHQCRSDSCSSSSRWWQALDNQVGVEHKREAGADWGDELREMRLAAKVTMRRPEV